MSKLVMALGILILALILFVPKSKRPVLKHREWRFGAGMLGLAAFVAAAWLGVRGSLIGWGAAAVLVVMGLGLVLTTRQVGARAGPKAPEAMSDDDARRILGVGPGATREEIQAAHKRLMRVAHPDQGGTAGLAAQINAARDRLLRRK